MGVIARLCCIRRTLFSDGLRTGYEPGVTESAEKDLAIPGAVEPDLCLLPVLGVLVKGEEVGDTTSSSTSEGSVAINKIFESDRLLVIPCEAACDVFGDTKEAPEADKGV